MPLILAIEPDRRQSAQLAAIVRQRVGAELILADTTERALDAIGNNVPDLVLVPALLSPQDDAALAAALRVIATAAHVRTLTIPVLATTAKTDTESHGVLGWLRRGRGESPAPNGCDPAVFADQVNAYLEECAAERAELEAAAREIDAPGVQSPEAAAPIVEAFSNEDLDAFSVAAAPVVREAAPASLVESAANEQIEASPLPMVEPAASKPIEASILPIVEPAAIDLIDLSATPTVDLSSIDLIQTAPAPTVDRDEIAFTAQEEPLLEVVSPASLEVVGDLEQCFDEAHVIDEDLEVVDNLVELSRDLGGMSAGASTDEIFDGDPVGVYSIPASDAAATTETAALFGTLEPLPAYPASIDVVPAVVTSRDERPVEAVTPIDLQLDEFEIDFIPVEDREPLRVVARSHGEHQRPAADSIPPMPLVARQSMLGASEFGKGVSEELEATENSERRRQPPNTDAWISMGLRHGRIWPELEGTLVETATEPDMPVAAAAVVAAAPRVHAPSPAAVAAPRGNAPSAAAVARAANSEWRELVASLRQDLERRRTGRPAIVAPSRSAAPPPARRAGKGKPVQDEWGFFDPEQCGFGALLAKLDEITDPPDELDRRRPA